MTQIFINAFHPWSALELNSNMDLQIISDPYSVADYVVDYVNKSNRGISNSHRDLMGMHDANPEYDQGLLSAKVGLKMSGCVEMYGDGIGRNKRTVRLVDDTKFVTR